MLSALWLIPVYIIYAVQMLSGNRHELMT